DGPRAGWATPPPPSDVRKPPAPVRLPAVPCLGGLEPVVLHGDHDLAAALRAHGDLDARTIAERTPPVAPLLGSARRRFGVEGNAVESVVVGDEREPAREPLVEITRKGLARVRGELPVTDLPLD